MGLIRRLGGRSWFVAAALAAVTMLFGTAHAATPRWVTGWPYFQDNSGMPVVWYTTQPQYFTDPGDLSAYVNHAGADALVASAAAVWNNSMSSVVLGKGGALNEHVSSANVYVGGSGPVFPSDVQASNYLAKPIAIIYDTDGSVTDTLLGGGASDPGNCRQSAVTESVDSIASNGQIQHALIVLNGRCTSSAAATQQEMEYRLIRAFGRVLGLGWSQLNDNVFTGVPQATSQQAQNWPVMHPIDILCGPYAYQCMVNPFTLRTDDLAALISMYPVMSAASGKSLSYANATKAVGYVSFANQQGMQGVLVSLRRFHFGPGYADAYDLTSTVSGQAFQQNAGNPVTPKGTTLASSLGSTNAGYEGYYTMNWVPVPSTDYFDNFTVTTSAINPLYTGQYSVGPYPVSQVTPSGPPMTGTQYVVNETYGARVDLTADGSSTASAGPAPAGCSAGADGTQYAPLAVASLGFWSETMCGYQHSAWSSLAVKAGRSLTMEVTAVDEQGYATTGKMLPVLGVWDSTDNTGTLPTLASQAVGLNASTLGMTNLMVSSGTARTLRIALADQRGDGRPDYAYNARVLYADAISPATLPANGGVVTISGMGFLPGNTVTVNGIAANVTGWTSNAITLVAPAITGPLSVDVVVNDVSTGGQTKMSGALSYSQTAQPDVLSVVSKPADGGYVGSAGSPVFKVQVMLPDGVTPAAGIGVVFSSAQATFGACGGASTCSLTTDGSGLVSSAVTPVASGTVGLAATVGAASVSTSFVALALPVDGLSVVSLPSGTVYATLPAATPFRVKVTLPDGTTAAAGVSVAVTAGNATLGGCSGGATCSLTADVSGTITTTVTPLAAGVVSLLATAGGGTVSASFGATTLPADVLHLVSKPADGSYVGRVAAVPLAVQVMLGDNATPASGASVTVSATGATLGACGSATCVVTADASGSASTSVTPSAAGTVTLTVAAGGGTLTATFNAAAVPADVLSVVSKPANGSYVGRAAAVPFVVHTALGDTAGAAAGVSVALTASGATLGCGGASCSLAADASGNVSTTVTPGAAGTVTLTASAGGGALSATFTAANVPVDSLVVATQPASGSYVGRVAGTPLAVQVMLGDGSGAAAGVSVVVTATNATLGACGAASCTLTADGTGAVATAVTPLAVGVVGLTAAAGGGTVSATFNAVALPPDVLHVVTQPANGSYVGSPAATAFSVVTLLGDTGAPASGASVTVTATSATLGCGASTCTLVANAAGKVSTLVTPGAAGLVTLSASTGGGAVTMSFTAINVPPDVLQVVSSPADNTYTGTAAALPFSVAVLLGDGVTPAAGVPVVVTAGNGATLGACGLSTCTMTATGAGTVSTMVTATAAGSVSLTATAGGGSVTASFAAINSPDLLQVVSEPADSSLTGRVAAVPFVVQVSVNLLANSHGLHALAAGHTPDVGAPVTLTAVGATLGACGLPLCTLTTDATGTVTTTVTPLLAGPVTLQAAAGGGMTSSSFVAATPPDVVRVTSTPANGSYANRSSSAPFAVQVFQGDGTTPAAAASVTLTATGGTLDTCGLATCLVTANSAGRVSTAVTPATVGTVTLTASAGGGTANSSFTAAAIPPDALHVVSQPANGTYAGRVASAAFTVQALLGDTGGPAAGAAVTVSAVNATLGGCGMATCVLTADANGSVSSAVTPIAPGLVTLSASAGGGSVSASFTSVAVPPDTLRIVTQPANGSYVLRSATQPFTLQVLLGDTGGAAAGVSVSLSAVNATLGACGLSMCVLTADSTGTVSTTVSPVAAGTVSLSAAAGGGMVTASFTAVAVPPDALHVVSQPANNSYVQRSATTPFAVQTVLGDTGAAASGVAVTISAVNATLAACGGSSCVLTADGSGNVSTMVTPLAMGIVTLNASAGGGSVSATFTAANVPPDMLNIVSHPADGSYVSRVAAVPLKVQALLGDTGAPAAGAQVTLSAAGATLGVCGASTCVVITDSNGVVSTPVTPNVAGPVQLTATAGGGVSSVTFVAAAIPVDALQVTSQPVNGAYINVTAASSFAVQVLLGDTGAPAAGASVTVTATNAILGACGMTSCMMTADGSGGIATTVTPVAVGPISITATAGGGTVTVVFNAAPPPPDLVRVVSQPSGSVYAGLVASAPLSVQVVLADGTTPASGTPVILSAANAVLGSCGGGSSCVLTTNSSGAISTTVTPQQAGTVTLHASAGGGSAAASFNALALPSDVLSVVSSPSSPAYLGSAAAMRFVVHVLLGDGSTVAVGAQVTVSASGASLGACSAMTCMLTADASGNVSTPVTPLGAGIVTLTAAAGGGTIATSFNAVADVLHVLTTPADGSYTGSVTTLPFAFQVLLGDGSTPVPGAAVTVTAANATLGACVAMPCTLIADSQGKVTTTVIASTAGTVTLTASSAGGTVSATFTAAATPDILEVQAAPANGSYVGRSAATPFTVWVALGNAINPLTATNSTVLPPAVGAHVTLTASGATLDACGSTTCSLTADATGSVTSTVTPTGVGVVSLSASAGGGTVSASFMASAAPDVVRVVSLPADGSYSGRFAFVPFAVRIFGADGVTPAGGASVTLTASSATFGACGQASCTLTADSTGTVSTSVTPLAAGVISLTATGGGGTVSASFTATLPPDIVQVISVPASGAYTGRAAASPFSVRVLLGDGVTPAAGVSVMLAATDATLGACGSANCAATTDANGLVSSAVTPLAAGLVTLQATAGGGTGVASFAAVDPVRTITISRATEYVAAGATVVWSPSVTVLENGVPLAGVNIVWSASAPGLALSAQSSTSDANGSATVAATIGPLAPGGSTAGQACAWTTACAAFSAVASDASLWRLAVASGDGQAVGANGTLQPLIVNALDQAGDLLAGVTIEVHQTVRGWVTCPQAGRCPTGPVLETGTSTIVSDANGQAVISPIEVSGTAEMTEIVAAAGTYGYVSASLAKTP